MPASLPSAILPPTAGWQLTAAVVGITQGVQRLSQWQHSEEQVYERPVGHGQTVIWPFTQVQESDLLRVRHFESEAPSYLRRAGPPQEQRPKLTHQGGQIDDLDHTVAAPPPVRAKGLNQ